MSLQGSLSIERMCELTRLSRASFYRSFREQHPVEEEMEVRSTIQRIAVEHRRRYGYRRIAAELRRRGMPVNHKRGMRLMAEDNLLAVRVRAFVVTTNSHHEFEVHLNLAGRMKLTGTNQLWVADITYIRLKWEFVYLAVILDAFSRKVVGWELNKTLAVRLALTALNKALVERNPRPGLVHHSDRGLQYASSEYVSVLTEVRHDAHKKWSNPLRISSRSRRVYTTLAVETEAVRKADAQQVEKRFLLSGGLCDPAQSDFAAVCGGQNDVAAVQFG